MEEDKITNQYEIDKLLGLETNEDGTVNKFEEDLKCYNCIKFNNGVNEDCEHYKTAQEFGLGSCEVKTCVENDIRKIMQGETEKLTYVSLLDKINGDIALGKWNYLRNEDGK